MQIPADLAAEMAPIDPAIGEFRVHYAGFFDPVSGRAQTGDLPRAPCSRCAARDVPFLLEDGQPVGRLVFERLAGRGGRTLRGGRDVQLSAPGAQTVEAFPQLGRADTPLAPGI